MRYCLCGYSPPIFAPVLSFLVQYRCRPKYGPVTLAKIVRLRQIVLIEEKDLAIPLNVSVVNPPILPSFRRYCMYFLNPH